MSAHRRYWTVETASLAVVALLTGVIAIWRSADEEGAGDTRTSPSTFFTGPRGLRALHLALDDLGVHVDRWMKPLSLTGAPTHRPGVVHLDRTAEDVRALAIVSPAVEILPDEADEIIRWVEEGGRLFLVPSRRGDILLERLQVPLEHSGKSIPTALDWIVEEVEEGAIEQGGLPGSFGPPDESERGRLSPRAARLLEGTPSSVKGFSRAFDGLAERDAGVEALLVRSSRDAALLLERGNGRVVLFAQARPITNRWIRESGAALLAARALADLAEGDVLWFDEFHHGFDEREGLLSRAWRFLSGSPAGWGILQAAIAGILVLAFAGLRLGRPIDPPSQRRRSALEHVDALSAAYQAARSRKRPARILVEGLRLRLRAPSQLDLEERLRGITATHPALRDATEAVLRIQDGAARPAEVQLEGLSGAIDRILAAVGEHDTTGNDRRGRP
ncbi:MAG TPA: DUF4350 domain-containing protein [Planctomycetota bacterium]|nr:DUF4350 domain-containing protein [Planctomycetota bacterium]